MIDIFAAASTRTYDPRYTDRSWLAGQVGGMIERAEWAELGGLLFHVALAVGPLAAPPARLAAAATMPTRSAAMGPPAWGDAAWITSELALHAAALAGVDGDLQALALRAAGVVSRIEV